MSDIRVDPDKVDEYANEIESIGGKMQTQMEETHSTATSLKADWTDRVQEEFESEFNKLKQGFDELIEQIPNYAKGARDYADAIRRIGR